MKRDAVADRLALSNANLSISIFTCIFLFVWQVLFFQFEVRPDEIKAVPTFLQFFTNVSYGLTEEIWVRLCLFLVNCSILLALYAIGLVERRTLYFVAIWPLTVFLFSKIYWEFFIFPLCFIRIDLKLRAEMAVLAGFAALLVATKEANLGVLMVFRAGALMVRLGFPKLAPIGIFISGIALDLALKTGAAFSIPFIGGLLLRFDWTRNFVNPDYSPIESVAVFFASFHFFSLHTGAFWIDALWSLIILFVLFGSPEFRQSLAENFALVACFFAVYFFFTNVTYAFQNARYYYFYIAILAILVPRKLYATLAILGVLHVILRSVEFF